MTEKEIKQALDDIAEVRHSIQSSLKIMRPLLLDRSFAFFSIIFGILLALLLTGAHFFSAQYGTFASMPTSLKWGITATIVLVIGGAGIIKQVIIKRILRKQDRSLTIFTLFKYPDFFNFYLLVIYGIVILAIALCWFCLTGTNSWWVIFPVCALFFGFIIALFAVAAQIAEYRILSAISTVSGFLVLFFMKDSQFLWLAAYVFVLFVSYGVMIFFARGNRITSE